MPFLAERKTDLAAGKFSLRLVQRWGQVQTAGKFSLRLVQRWGQVQPVAGFYSKLAVI